VEDEAKFWLKADRDSMTNLGFELEDFSVSNKTKDEVEKKLEEVDGIIMAGGNTFFLLQQLKYSRSLDLIRKFVQNGGVYIGSSAGSIVAGPDIWPVRMLDTKEKGKKIDGYKGIALTDVVILPHWGSESFREKYLGERLVQNYNNDHKLMLLTDFQYLIIDNENLQFIDTRER
jgi:dipeptidase E